MKTAIHEKISMPSKVKGLTLEQLSAKLMIAVRR